MSLDRIERTIKFFDSHEQADQANFEYYKTLTPDQRIEIALELMRPTYEAYPRFERIYRTVELGECPVSVDWGHNHLVAITNPKSPLLSGREF